ncbi:hypothetical protein NEOLI_004022 [Neolecta irregularis DAH-3]|uniref:Uncharacterized protein n=1 Tax=Neolecta irregularis (strain DAH-3) TaxID=1198029 RepID=A0A1U7LME1_NEOID|nr:hypothetical protein NEOLI_004022 [Neolecta irregularis DAH-3]|eukprot:OLL23798.1 hypothetical protein NEOLI_004022 [Neolecta irregularis DAH-3]
MPNSSSECSQPTNLSRSSSQTPIMGRSRGQSRIPRPSINRMLTTEDQPTTKHDSCFHQVFAHSISMENNVEPDFLRPRDTSNIGGCVPLSQSTNKVITIGQPLATHSGWNSQYRNSASSPSCISISQTQTVLGPASQSLINTPVSENLQTRVSIPGSEIFRSSATHADMPALAQLIGNSSASKHRISPNFMAKADRKKLHLMEALGISPVQFLLTETADGTKTSINADEMFVGANPGFSRSRDFTDLYMKGTQDRVYKDISDSHNDFLGRVSPQELEPEAPDQEGLCRRVSEGSALAPDLGLARIAVTRAVSKAPIVLSVSENTKEQALFDSTGSYGSHIPNGTTADFSPEVCHLQDDNNHSHDENDSPAKVIKYPYGLSSSFQVGNGVRARLLEARRPIPSSTSNNPQTELESEPCSDNLLISEMRHILSPSPEGERSDSTCSRSSRKTQPNRFIVEEFKFDVRSTPCSSKTSPASSCGSNTPLSIFEEKEGFSSGLNVLNLGLVESLGSGSDFPVPVVPVTDRYTVIDQSSSWPIGSTSSQGISNSRIHPHTSSSVQKITHGMTEFQKPTEYTPITSMDEFPCMYKAGKATNPAKRKSIVLNAEQSRYMTNARDNTVDSLHASEQSTQVPARAPAVHDGVSKIPPECYSCGSKILLKEKACSKNQPPLSESKPKGDEPLSDLKPTLGVEKFSYEKWLPSHTQSSIGEGNANFGKSRVPVVPTDSKKTRNRHKGLTIHAGEDTYDLMSESNETAGSYPRPIDPRVHKNAGFQHEKNVDQKDFSQEGGKQSETFLRNAESAATVGIAILPSSTEDLPVALQVPPTFIQDSSPMGDISESDYSLTEIVGNSSTGTEEDGTLVAREGTILNNAHTFEQEILHQKVKKSRKVDEIPPMSLSHQANTKPAAVIFSLATSHKKARNPNKLHTSPEEKFSTPLAHNRIPFNREVQDESMVWELNPFDRQVTPSFNEENKTTHLKSSNLVPFEDEHSVDQEFVEAPDHLDSIDRSMELSTKSKFECSSQSQTILQDSSFESSVTGGINSSASNTFEVSRPLLNVEPVFHGVEPESRSSNNSGHISKISLFQSSSHINSFAHLDKSPNEKAKLRKLSEDKGVSNRDSNNTSAGARPVLAEPNNFSSFLEHNHPNIENRDSKEFLNEKKTDHKNKFTQETSDKSLNSEPTALERLGLVNRKFRIPSIDGRVRSEINRLESTMAAEQFEELSTSNFDNSSHVRTELNQTNILREGTTSIDNKCFHKISYKAQGLLTEPLPALPTNLESPTNPASPTPNLLRIKNSLVDRCYLKNIEDKSSHPGPLNSQKALRVPCTDHSTSLDEILLNQQFRQASGPMNSSLSAVSDGVSVDPLRRFSAVKHSSKDNSTCGPKEALERSYSKVKNDQFLQTQNGIMENANFEATNLRASPVQDPLYRTARPIFQRKFQRYDHIDPGFSPLHIDCGTKTEASSTKQGSILPFQKAPFRYEWSRNTHNPFPPESSDSQQKASLQQSVEQGTNFQHGVRYKPTNPHSVEASTYDVTDVRNPRLSEQNLGPSTLPLDMNLPRRRKKFASAEFPARSDHGTVSIARRGRRASLDNVPSNQAKLIISDGGRQLNQQQARNRFLTRDKYGHSQWNTKSKTNMPNKSPRHYDDEDKRQRPLLIGISREMNEAVPLILRTASDRGKRETRATSDVVIKRSQSYPYIQDHREKQPPKSSRTYQIPLTKTQQNGFVVQSSVPGIISTTKDIPRTKSRKSNPPIHVVSRTHRSGHFLRSRKRPVEIMTSLPILRKGSRIIVTNRPDLDHDDSAWEDQPVDQDSEPLENSLIKRTVPMNRSLCSTRSTSTRSRAALSGNLSRHVSRHASRTRAYSSNFGKKSAPFLANANPTETPIKRIISNRPNEKHDDPAWEDIPLVSQPNPKFRRPRPIQVDSKQIHIPSSEILSPSVMSEDYLSLPSVKSASVQWSYVPRGSLEYYSWNPESRSSQHIAKTDAETFHIDKPARRIWLVNRGAQTFYREGYSAAKSQEASIHEFYGSEYAGDSEISIVPSSQSSARSKRRHNLSKNAARTRRIRRIQSFTTEYDSTVSSGSAILVRKHLYKLQNDVFALDSSSPLIRFFARFSRKKIAKETIEHAQISRKARRRTIIV